MNQPVPSTLQPGQTVIIRVGNLAGIPASVVARQEDNWLIALSSFGPGVYVLVNETAIDRVDRD